MRGFVRAFLALATLAVAACYAFDEGRQQSWTFETQQAATDVRQRSAAHLARTGYQVLHADDRLIEAEKQREVGAFDVLRVIVEATGDAGTRVRVQGLSEEGSGGGRTESRQVSATALADGQALADALAARSSSWRRRGGL
jgi:hypothetical protein